MHTLDGLRKQQLSCHLAFGEFSSTSKPMFRSTRKHGEFIAKMVPKSAIMDAALRTNSKWLWEALNIPDHTAATFLKF